MAFDFKNLFGGATQATEYKVEVSFPWELESKNFCNWFVLVLYRKILTDCFARSSNIPEDKKGLFWDSVVSTEASRGLISIVSEAMADKKNGVYLVYKNGTVREADTPEERKAIEDDKTGASGICLNFANFYQSSVLKELGRLLFCLLKNANMGLHLSQSVLLKISNLRQSVADLNAEHAIKQARDIASALKENGKGALLDAADAVELPPYDAEPMEKSLEVLFGLVSMVTGLPQSYVNGLIYAGLSNSGEADELAVERGLAYYFHSVFCPVVKKLLHVTPVFKTSEWRKFSEIANLLPVLDACGSIPEEFRKRLIAELRG